MSGHTKEPWRVKPAEHGSNCFYVVDGDATSAVARVTNYKMQGVGEANARRIVACVNACAAIPTEELEKAATDPTAGMFGRLAGKSVSQRDHAVRALSQLLSVLDDPRRTAEQTHDALEAARSAVATITGVQS